MGWLSWASSPSSRAEEKVSITAAEEAIGVLFHKKPVPQASAVTSAKMLITEIPTAPAEAAAVAASPSSTAEVLSASGNKRHSSKVVAPAVVTHSQPDVPLVDWKLLPPSPVGGYKLVDNGLCDMMAPGRPILSPVQLKALILEASALEGQAKAIMDESMPKHVRITMQNKFTVVLNQLLGFLGIALILYKVPSRYENALPRDSILFRSSVLSRMTGVAAWDENTTEAFARKHRMLLRISTRRVGGTIACGLGLMLSSWTLWDSFGAVTERHDAAVIGKDQATYHIQTKISAQWLWTVYFHHPAYMNSSASVVPPLPMK